jgi:hypothetical protein
MTTPIKKRAVSAKAKPQSTLPPKPTAPEPQPFFRFYHSTELRAKTLSLLDTVEQASDPTAHRDAFSDLVVELTNGGLDYYFMKQLKLAKPGFILEQSTNLGMAGVQQIMGSVTRKIIGGMSGPQLLSVCGSIRQLML